MSNTDELLDQLRVQLAGCGAAACGATNPEHVAVKGDYGWSPSYEDTLRLRRHFDKIYTAMSRLRDNGTLPVELANVLAEIRSELRST